NGADNSILGVEHLYSFIDESILGRSVFRGDEVGHSDLKLSGFQDCEIHAYIIEASIIFQAEIYTGKRSGGLDFFAIINNGGRSCGSQYGGVCCYSTLFDECT